HAIAVYASRPLSPVATQHSLPSGRYSLLVPDFHRLDRTSFAWRTHSDHRIPPEARQVTLPESIGWTKHQNDPRQRPSAGCLLEALPALSTSSIGQPLGLGRSVRIFGNMSDESQLRPVAECYFTTKVARSIGGVAPADRP